MGDLGGQVQGDHAKRFLTGLKAAAVIFLAYTVFQLMHGRERQFTACALPAVMVAALWFPGPEGWWFLAAGIPLCAFRNGYDGNWAVTLGLIASAGCLPLCRSLFFPQGRLFHWAFGALAVWVALMLFGLPRAERSFFPARSRSAAESGPLSLEPLLSKPTQSPPPEAASPPILLPPPPEAPRKPGDWQPKPELARKLTLVYERAPEKILESKDSGPLLALTMKLDDLLKSPTKDEKKIEAAADEILAVIGVPKPKEGPVDKPLTP